MIGQSVAAWSYWSQQLFTQLYWITSDGVASTTEENSGISSGIQVH